MNNPLVPVHGSDPHRAAPFAYNGIARGLHARRDLALTMPTETTPASPPPVLQASAVHEGAALALWRVLTRFDSTKVSLPRALRNSAGVVMPLIAGFALNMPRGGLVVASGALNVAYSDGSDPYAQRAKRMLSSSILCALAVLLGALSGSRNAPAVAVATLWAFVAGMFTVISTTAGDLGVISLVTLLIYAAQSLTPHQAVFSCFLALAGGLLQTGLSIAFWPVRRYEPERRALANLFLELAHAAETPLSATSAPPATVHTTQAQEALSGLARDAAIEAVRYRALLNQAERIRLSLLMLSRLRLRMQRESPSHSAVRILDDYLKEIARILRIIGDSLISSTPAASFKMNLDLIEQLSRRLRGETASLPPSFLSAVAKDARFQMDALNGQLRSALELAANSTSIGHGAFVKQEAQQPWRLRFSGLLAALRANLNLQSSAFRHALRLAAMVALGNILERSFYWRRSYWLPMTIVLVLKPEFTATFTRGLLRISGTIAGLLLATSLFHFLPHSTALQIILIFAFTLVLRWIGPANYGLFAVAISALVVLLIAMTGLSPGEVIWARGINTTAGGALALLAYWIWPTWERTRISERIAQMLDAYREYFHFLSESYQRGKTGSSRELDRLRLRARVARSNLEASIDRLSTEPGTTAEYMNRLNALLASSHRFVNAVMALDADWLQSARVPPRPAFHTFAADLEKTLELLVAALRGTRVSAREFPDLREDHNVLVQSGDPRTERYALVNVEADRITNSLNTLREQVLLQGKARSGA